MFVPPSSFPLWGKMRMVVFHLHLHLPWCPTCQQGSQKSRNTSITVNNGWNVFSKWGVDFVWSIRCLRNDGLIPTIVFKVILNVPQNDMRCQIWLRYCILRGVKCENYHQVYHEVPKELLITKQMFQVRVESLSPLFGVSQGHAHGHAKYAKAQRADAPSRWRHQVVGWGWAFHVVHHMGSGRCNMVVDVAADPAARIGQA